MTGQPHLSTLALRRAMSATLAASLLLGACSGDDGGSSDAGDATGDAGSSVSSPPGSSAAPTTVASDPSGSSGALLDVAAMSTVKGTDGRVYLADGDGRAIQLRGYNIKTDDPLESASDQAFADGQSRGFNVVRLSVYWHLLEPTQGAYDEEYLAAIATVLDRAEAHDTHVIVSFHQDVFGPAFGFGGIPEWATRTDGETYTRQDVWLMNYLEPAVQNAYEHLYEDEDLRQAQADAWALVAERFGAHRAVIGYDLLNEPFGKLHDGEQLPEAAARVQSTQLTDMYNRLIDAMRPYDADGWMFVEAPNVASIGLPVSLGSIEDDRVVFFPHMYDPDIETANYTDGNSQLDTSFFTMFEPLIRAYADEHELPLMIGEWGIAAPERDGMDVFVHESLALMDRVGSGWTMFTWCRGESYCPIDAEGADRPNIGQIVQPWARAVAGAPVSFGLDPDTRTFTLVFEPADIDAPSQIVVPSSFYPEGFSVSSSAADGDWGHELDTDAMVLDVTMAAGGEPVAVCVAPGDTPATCEP